MAERYAGSKISKKTSQNIPRTIYNKITQGLDPKKESKGLRAFRELLQNSDDAMASTLTIRFDKDRMYSHNDGFTIEYKFVDALSEILDSPKYKQKGTSGNFGSGFRSTYIFTDAPELEWWDFEKEVSCPECGEAQRISTTMPEADTNGEPFDHPCKSKCGYEGALSEFTAAPSDSPLLLAYRTYSVPLGLEDGLDWQDLDPDSIGVETGFSTFDREVRDPVMGADEEEHTSLGVMFRYPWRTKNRLKKKEERWNEFIWNAEQIRDFVDDLREYAPIALLGCRHLKNIRIVNAGIAKKEEDRWDLIASRDTTISQLKKQNERGDDLSSMTVCTHLYHRDEDFYDLDKSGTWKRTDGKGHQWYDNREINKEAFRDSEQEKRWEYRPYCPSGVDNELSEQMCYWDFQALLLPLSPFSPPLPVYTPIPLAGITPNRFAVVAMLPPEETRLRVSISDTKQSEWLEANIKTASVIYEKHLGEHLSILRERNLSGTRGESHSTSIERAMVNCLPRNPPNTWFGDAGTIGRNWATEEDSPIYDLQYPLEHLGEVALCAKEEPFFLNNLQETAYIGSATTGVDEAQAETLRTILQDIKAPLLSSQWEDYILEVKQSSTAEFYGLLKKWVLGASMSPSNPEQFANLVQDHWHNVGDTEDLIKISSTILDGICEKALSEEWAKSALGHVLSIPCVVSQEGRLGRIPDFFDTNKEKDLELILPDSQLVHENYRETALEKISKSKDIKEAINGIAEQIQPTGDDILILIDQDTKLRPEVHDDLESHEEVYKAVSNLLRRAFDPKDTTRNNLGDPKLRELRFVPCKRHGRVVTLQNNIFKEMTWGFGDLSPSSQLTMTSLYHREFIYKLRTPSIDELPQCVSERLRFLCLHEDVKPNRASDVLGLNSVGQGAKMTNLARTLLFEHSLGKGKLPLSESQPSLFRPDTLSEWLRLPPLHMGVWESRPNCAKCSSPMSMHRAVLPRPTCDDQNNPHHRISDEFHWRCECTSPATEYCIGHGPIPERDVGYDEVDVKTGLLSAILKPYGDKLSDGLGHTDKRIRENPPEFVLGSDGDWRTPEQFCLVLDPSLSGVIDDLTSIDTDFRNNIGDAGLQLIGVQRSLGPNSAKSAIAAKKGDPEAISLLMLSLLSSESSWHDCGNDGDERAWTSLRNDAWIPLSSGKSVLPDNALFPSEENVTIMGDSYPFFPLPSTWDELRGANHSKRAAELGFRMEVETGTLVYAINQAGGDGADPSHAVKELSKRLSKKSDDYTIGISELDRSPAHACGEHLKVRVNGQDDPLSTDKGTIWAVEDTESLQSLQGLWPDRQIALIDQLTDIDRKTIDGLRKLKDKSQNTILGEWPEWEDFLWKLSSPHLDPQQIELAWILLKGRPEPPGDEISKIELVLEEIRDDPPLVVSFSHEGKCIGVKDGMLTTSVEEDDGTLDPSGKTIVYVPKEEETLLFWLSIIGAQEASKLTDKERLDFMVGEVFDDVDGQDRDRAREVKSLIGRAQSHHYTLVFDGPGTAKLIKVVDASPAIYAPRLRPVPHIFQSFPIIHEVDEDDSKYKIHNKDVISHLHNCHSYSEVSSSVPRPDEKKFSAHAALQEATTNILRAIEKIYPRVFEDLSNSLEIHCFMGDQGTGIPIFTTLDGDDFGTDDQEAITSRVQEAHKYEKFEEKLTLYVQEGTKNPSRKFSRLLLQGITETEWYPSLADSLDENPNLKIRIEELFSELLDTNIDEWGDIHDKLENHGLEPHGRPFESNDRAQMAQKMRNEYNGCQICKLITPDGENSPYTKETVKSTITERGGPYRARRKRTFPHGRVLWLCPRHRILWERKCIKLQFMEEAFPDGWVWRSPKNIPEAIRKDAIRNLTSHKANHQSGSDIEISVYDGDVSIGGIQSTQAEWNQKWLTVTDEHASKIFDEMIAFLKEGAA